MIEEDTIKLLRECDAGLQMGISSINEVLEYIDNETFKNRLSKCKEESKELRKELLELLDTYHDDGKAPNPMAKGMSWVKTNVMLVVKQSDKTIANLMTEGCNMGVKSLNKYLNQYKNANEKSKDLTRRIADSEERLVIDIRRFL